MVWFFSGVSIVEMMGRGYQLRSSVFSGRLCRCRLYDFVLVVVVRFGDEGW